VRVRPPQWLPALVVCCTACDRQILVGPEEPFEASSSAPDALLPDGADLDAHSSSGDDSGLVPLVVPWSTGFESAPGDSWVPGNPSDCYVSGGASFQLVTTPVHGGQHAAAFRANTAAVVPPSASQTRCVKRGVLPMAAYYGAWYHVPAPATNSGNWNLLHFRGADVPQDSATHGLWDVSLANAADGTLHLVVYDFLRKSTLQTTGTVPIGAWVHLEVYLRRAADSTGQFTLRRDGQVVLDLTGIATDDSRWGEWFVGNLATSLSPPSSTVYVDDVTIQ
jgi:hypothetical protein